MTSRELLGRALAFALALLLFVGTYFFAFILWATLLDATGDFDLWSADREDAIWFVLIATALWVAVGALIGRWWVLAVPLVPYAWERGRELVEFGEVGFDDGAYSYEAWLVIAVCALGIGCGLRVWAARRDAV
jgi:hypothetical protein